jgi:hypothetical protein
MIEIENAEILRKSISDSFAVLVANALRSGWAEHDLALMLTDLAETYVMDVGSRMIADNSLRAQHALDTLKN